ncbi:protein LPA3-like [Lolium rigidum]|uniref:protein LPA3-like n=1 Tax=Lolium rigidum TaxID=89674 RepID=UPI001F5C5F70|nr:protein LPA3-like [Lolium rigidum]
MVMATSYSISNPPLTFKTSPLNKQVPNWRLPTIRSGNGSGGMLTMQRRTLRTCFHVCAVTGDQSTSNAFSAKFPSDYTELIMQAKEATESAFKDGKQLLEIEFPTAGLQSVPGDGEGGIEMTGSMLLIREFCDRFVPAEKATRTRIFFPEANEVTFARQSAFEGCSLKLDYLTKPSLFEDFGFTTKVKMADRVQPNDETFLVAYPYFNVNEMLVVEELYKEAVLNTERKLIIFNGELDRIRSGYYPPFFYPKLAELSKTFLPKLETVYYIHNFKGSKGGALFRCYPGPWKVLRKVGGSFICLHEQEEMPSLKEVALDILPSA